MNKNISKEHTGAYTYLKAVADRLAIKSRKTEGFFGRCADEARASILRQCCREWDEAVAKAMDSGYPLDDIRAAMCRLKDGKRWLTFLDDTRSKAAA